MPCKARCSDIQSPVQDRGRQWVGGIPDDDNLSLRASDQRRSVVASGQK